jgi:hypothetical protein
METQIFHHSKKHNLQKIKCSKINQNPSRYHDFITNLKFQHKPKYELSGVGGRQSKEFPNS